MYFLTLFFVSILPGILWVWYFYKKDIYDPEPKQLIVRDFIMGMVIVLPVSLLEEPFGGLLTPGTPLPVLFFATIFIVGIIEEGAKSLIVYRFHYRHPEFDEPIDGMIYGITVGLGFAAAENLFYTMIYGYQVGLTRAVLTSLAHASFTGIFGYFLSRARREKNKYLIPAGYFLVSVIHGIYNFLIIGNIVSFYITMGIILALQLYLASLLQQMSEISPFK
ncbi:MAG: PrsW family intramembrane metalloprotease [Halanaerobiaceae bacterium]